MKQNKKEVDYKVFFILGISLLALGIICMGIRFGLGISFLGAGVCFLAIELANKSKWK